MPKRLYFPIIKTREAELKGISFLDEKIKDKILPTFELTRPRPYTTGKGEEKRTSHKDVELQIGKIFEVYGKRPFILDITEDRNLHNPQMSRLTNSADGYSEWCDFVERDPLVDYVVPALQVDTKQLSDTLAEFKRLGSGFKTLSLTVDFFDYKEEYGSEKRFAVHNRTVNKNIFPVIDFALKNIGAAELLVTLNLGYIPHRDSETYFSTIENKIKEMQGQYSSFKKRERYKIIMAMSSFPSYVLAAAKGRECDTIPCLENVFLLPLCKKHEFLIGDYASIHPVKYPVGGGGWVPRIDYLSSDGKNYVYCRNETTDEQNGYITSARAVLKRPDYSPLHGTIGARAIDAAAIGELEGRSPAFWIAVRMEQFITQKIISLKKDDIPYLEL